MMDKSHLTEKILKLTLEIIYLLTGEDYSEVNKTGQHGGTLHEAPGQPRELHKPVRRITGPPPSSEVPAKTNNEKILELTNKIIRLLTGEVPVRCEDIIVCFSTEEWEYVEGHKELYKDLVMKKRQASGSSDSPSSENSSMKLNSGMLSVDTERKADSSTLCKPNSNNNVFEDVRELPLPSEHDHLNNTSTCTKWTQTELADRGKGISYEDKEADVIFVSTENTGTGYSSVASRSYNNGSRKDSDFCLLTEQIQNAVDPMESEVESGEDGILVVDNTYTPPRLKSTNLTGQPTEWVTNLNYVEYPLTPRHINDQYASGCIIEVATVCEEGNFTSTDICTPTDHKTTLHMAEETPMSWGKDVIYTKFYTPEELTQADLTSIKKELVSWEDGSMELQNMYVRPKRLEEKAVSRSSRGDAVQWSRSQPRRDSYSSLGNASPRIKTEYDQGDFEDYSTTSGQIQPLHASGDPEDYNMAAIKKENVTKNMSIISYNINGENDGGKAAYAVSQIYSCSDCKRCFTSDANLAKHRLMCRGRKPHVCSGCGKCFASASYLVIHERIHTGEKPYACSHCGKCFTRKPDLIRHERIHTGEKPFSCPECGKCFTSVSNIFMHRRIHTGEKPFPCAQCGKRFIKKSDLVRHEKIHLPQEPLPCPHCGKLFYSKIFLSKHIALHTAKTAQGGS